MRLVLGFICLAAFTCLSACGRVGLTDEIKIQEDYDHLRLDHLEYWTALIEAFEEKTGHFPLQNIVPENKYGHVQILPPNSEESKVNWGESFYEFEIDDLRAALEKELNKPVKMKFPPETTPPTYAFAYNYFVEPDGYLFWVSCQSCGITEISTYTMDGKTATVNIASAGMVPKVTKAKSREDMLNHPRYKIWRSIKVHDENRVKQIRNRYK